MRVKKEFFKAIFGNALRGTNAFRALYSDKGFAKAVAWFEDFTKGNSGRYLNRMNENQFLIFLRQLTSFSDHEILSILDIFDVELNSSVGFDEFLLILSLLSAREYGNLTEFLYYHDTAMFQILYGMHTKDRKPTLTFTQFAQLGFVLGIQTGYVQETLAKWFNIDIISAEFGLDSFTLYYFGIFQLMDRYALQTHNTVKQSKNETTSLSRRSLGLRGGSLRGGAPVVTEDGMVEIRKEPPHKTKRDNSERELKTFASVFNLKKSNSNNNTNNDSSSGSSSSGSIGKVASVLSPGRVASWGSGGVGTPRSARNSSPANERAASSAAAANAAKNYSPPPGVNSSGARSPRLSVPTKLSQSATFSKSNEQ